MSKPALGILVGILIFIAAGCLAVFWVAKMRQDKERQKTRIAYTAIAHRQVYHYEKIG